MMMSRRDATLNHLGFGLCLAVGFVCVHMALSGPSSLVRLLAMALGGVSLLLVLLPRRRYSYSFGLITITCLYALLVSPNAGTPSQVGLLAASVAMLALAVIRHRIGWRAFAAAGILGGILAALALPASSPLAVGALAGGTLLGLMILINYLYQLVDEHRSSVRDAWTLLGSRERWNALLLVGKLYIPVLILVGAGGYLGRHLRFAAKSWVYCATLAPAPRGISGEHSDIAYFCDTEHSSAPSDAVERASSTVRDINLELEFRRAIDQRTSKTGLRADTLWTDAHARGNAALAAVPAKTADAIEEVRPQPIDKAVCDNAKPRIWRFRIPLQPLCRGMLTAVDGALQRAFDNAKARALARVNRAVDDARIAGAGAVGVGGRATQQSIAASGRELSSSVAFGFAIARAAQLLGLLTLLGALLAGFQMVAGRVLFDQEHREFGLKERAEGGRPAGFEYHVSNELRLDLVDTPHERFRGQHLTWYIHLGREVSGSGYPPWLSLPKPLQCTLRRLVTGRLLMNRVDSKASDGDRTVPVTVTCPNDYVVTSVVVEPDAEIVVRIGDIIGFTSGVSFRVVYTTHVGRYLLGLGAFYVVAEGDGLILLRGVGQSVQGAAEGSPVKTCNPFVGLSGLLLAYERSVQFRLVQKRTFLGVWLNEPAVTVTAGGKSALRHHAPLGRPSLVRPMWRVVRYAVLPF